ncbi:MAG: hypothetical protein ABSG83_06870 [Roseiarcus sp.]|jgi:hypothetical protein
MAGEPTNARKSFGDIAPQPAEIRRPVRAIELSVKLKHENYLPLFQKIGYGFTIRPPSQEPP